MPGSFALNGWGTSNRFPTASRRYRVGFGWSFHGRRDERALCEGESDILDGVVLWVAHAGAEDDIPTQERVLSFV